ncbi:hypothetical protein HD806DRAFT_552921 [Xylariaceae sp. AK1471]|nr:hypothetical protein HD806DRAFT_552921 [Xylariaceae sp. AK1471]
MANRYNLRYPRPMPGGRGLDMSRYFSDEHHFQFEHDFFTALSFRRVRNNRLLERIVVKLAPANSGREDETRQEERCLRDLWGCEHIVRLIAIADDEEHEDAEWDEPPNRPNLVPRQPLPWKLEIDPQTYPRILYPFFVMEHVPRGSGEQLLRRCEELGIPEISEEMLWSFFVCLTRACVGIAYPPNAGDNSNPPAVWRENLPVTRPPSIWVHGDLHLGNIMFGETETDPRNPLCHYGPPQGDAIEAQQEMIRCVGDAMEELACGYQRDVFDIEDRDEFDVSYPPIEPVDFETYASEDFRNSERLSEAFRELVSRCLAKDPQDRPTLRNLLSNCVRQAGLVDDWITLADEASDLFDSLDVVDDNSNDGDYNDN